MYRTCRAYTLDKRLEIYFFIRLREWLYYTKQFLPFFFYFYRYLFLFRIYMPRVQWPPSLIEWLYLIYIIIVIIKRRLKRIKSFFSLSVYRVFIYLTRALSFDIPLSSRASAPSAENRITAHKHTYIYVFNQYKYIIIEAIVRMVFKIEKKHCLVEASGRLYIRKPKERTYTAVIGTHTFLRGDSYARSVCTGIRHTTWLVPQNVNDSPRPKRCHLKLFLVAL